VQQPAEDRGLEAAGDGRLAAENASGDALEDTHRLHACADRPERDRVADVEGTDDDPAEEERPKRLAAHVVCRILCGPRASLRSAAARRRLQSLEGSPSVF